MEQDPNSKSKTAFTFSNSINPMDRDTKSKRCNFEESLLEYLLLSIRGLVVLNSGEPVTVKVLCLGSSNFYLG